MEYEYPRFERDKNEGEWPVSAKEDAQTSAPGSKGDSSPQTAALPKLSSKTRGRFAESKNRAGRPGF